MKFSILTPFFLAIDGAKEQRCNLAEILAEIFEENVDRKSEIQRLKRGYKIRPDKENNQKNAFSFRLKKKELINWKPENGAAVGFIRCSYQPDLRTKIKCLPNGKAVLEGPIHKCERGCDISKLGLFSENADNSCEKTESGIEAQGSRCKRRCVLNSSIETARPIICECNGKFCKYTVGHQGKNLPFNPEPLEKLCREHKIEDLNPKINLQSQKERQANNVFGDSNGDFGMLLDAVSENFTEQECRSYFTGEFDSGCWSLVAGKCHLTNPACFRLTCLEDSMSGWFRRDLLGEPEDDINTLSTKLRKDAGGFKFQEVLGETGSIIRDEDEVISFTRVFTDREFASPVYFKCNYQKKTIISRESSQFLENTIESTASWEDFSIDFTSKPKSLGDPVGVAITWNSPPSKLEIGFHPVQCSVPVLGSHFPVIENSCYASPLKTIPSSDAQIWSNEQFSFSFESFSYAGSSEFEFTEKVICDIEFCLDSSCPINKSCPQFYNSPF